MKAKDILKRYIFSTLGMLLVALGIAVSIVANLGTSPLNAASYAMAEGLEGLSVGTCNFIIYAIFVLLQFVFIVLACVITAFGISMEVAAQAWMLPAEMTVSAFTRRFGGKFDTNKVIMDCLMLLLGALLCLWFFDGRPFGPEGKPIIGWGTLIMAVCIGLMMKGSSPLIDKLWNRIYR